jgi:hypothetical protein
MTEIVEVLYCFGCQKYRIIEQIGERPDKPTDCGAERSHKSTVGAVRVAMQMAGLKPRRLDELPTTRKQDRRR